MQGEQALSAKGQIVNVSDFVGHSISLTTTLTTSGVKATIDNLLMNVHGYVQ